jgi:HlyD family secretion protein
MKQQIKEYWPLMVPVTVLIIAIGFWIGQSDDEKLAIGMVEAEYVDVASEIPGRLLEKHLKIGDFVKKGQILARMSPKEVNAIKGQSQAAVDVAEAQLELVKNGARKEERNASKNAYLASKDQYNLAEQTWKRMDLLYKDSVVSGQEHDLAKFNYNVARKQMNIAKSNYDMVQHGARPETIKAAEAMVKQAKDLHTLNSSLGENLDITAPCDGIISSVSIHEGEVIMIGYPLSTIQKDNTLHVILQVKQDELPKVEIGAVIKGKIPGVSNEFIDFEVVHRSVMMDYADWVPTNEKGTFDLKTFEVHLEPINKIENLLPGMTVGFKL